MNSFAGFWFSDRKLFNLNLIGALTLLHLSLSIACGQSGRPAGTVVSWGIEVIPYVPPEIRYKAIAAGTSHSLALKQDGTVVTWGTEDQGESLTPPIGLTKVIAIAAGHHFSLALKVDGTLVAWGRNMETQVTVPVGLVDVIAISAGSKHSLALKQDGTVIAWGSNELGQATVPEELAGVTAIAAGYYHSLALKQDGTVVAWGANSFGQATVPRGLTGVIAIVAEGQSSVALKKDGTLVNWGAGFSSRPGDLAQLRDVTAIALGSGHLLALKQDGTVVALGSIINGKPIVATVPEGLKDVAAIAAGGWHDLALKHDGTLITWGGDTYVPLGLNGITAIATKGHHTLALKEDGTVVSWGGNYFAESDVPLGLSGVTAVSAGASHSLALKQDGTVVAWGYNKFGQSTVPGGLTGVTAIAAGYYHSLALKQDGTVVAWGDNEYGESIVPSGLTEVTAIAAGNFQSLALKQDGTVITWGAHVDFDSTHIPATVPAGLSQVVAIAAGNSHSLALKQDGTVEVWGYLPFGPPPGFYKLVAGGEQHSLALKQDGTVVAFGNNGNGQTTVPGSLPPAFAIAAGDFVSLAIVHADDTVRTLAASSIATTSVKMNAYINPNGYNTTAYFEFGTTDAYGNTTRAGNFGLTAQDIAFELSGIEPNTTYHYRIVAINSTGNRHGNDVTFTTSPISAAAQSAWVSGTDGLGLRLRSNPNLSSSLLTVIPEGAEVAFLGETQTGDAYLWRRIQFGGETGWAASQYLIFSREEAFPSPSSAPTSLQQFQSDEKTPVSAGQAVNNNSVVLSAIAGGLNSQQMIVQFEVRPLAVVFSNPTHQSNLGRGGAPVIVSVKGLSNQGYHWRARSLDGNGHTSPWADFGNGIKPDFLVNPTTLTSALFEWNPPIAVTGVPVQFIAHSTGGAGWTFQWNFGAGGSETGQTASHTFNMAIPATVILTVTDPMGNQTTHAETVPVASGQLQDAINLLAQSTSNFLDQISVQAQQVADAADDFKASIDNAPGDIAISAAFTTLSLGLIGAEYKELIKSSIGQDAVISIVSDIAQSATTWAHDEFFNHHRSSSEIFMPNIKALIGQKKSEVEKQRQAAIAASVTFTPQQAVQLTQNLRARYAGNISVSDDYADKATLPVTFDDLKASDESSWTSILADNLFTASVDIGLGAIATPAATGISGATAMMLNVYFTSSLSAVNTLGILSQQSSDVQMFSLSLDILLQATRNSRIIADNTKAGLQDVVTAQVTTTPRGQISVQHLARGSIEQFGFSPRWLTTSAYAEVTVNNSGAIPATYCVRAVYPNKFTTTHLPIHGFGIAERNYDISVLSVTDPIMLAPGSQKTVSINFVTERGGHIPNGDITYTLVALTDDGEYLQARTTGHFSTSLIDESGNVVEHSAMPQVLLEDTFLNSTLVEFGGSTIAKLAITITDPTEVPVLLDLRQALPAGTLVYDPAGGTFNKSGIYWEFDLLPGETRLIEIVLTLPSSVGRRSAITNTVASVYDEVGGDWLQVQRLPNLIQISESPPAQLQPLGISDKGFGLAIQTFVPGVFRVETTKDFRTWIPVITYTNIFGVTNIYDGGVMTNTAQFYRAVEVL